jgi:hypothetical protein
MSHAYQSKSNLSQKIQDNPSQITRIPEHFLQELISTARIPDFKHEIHMDQIEHATITFVNQVNKLVDNFFIKNKRILIGKTENAKLHIFTRIHETLTEALAQLEHKLTDITKFLDLFTNLSFVDLVANEVIRKLEQYIEEVMSFFGLGFRPAFEPIINSPEVDSNAKFW